MTSAARPVPPPSAARPRPVEAAPAAEPTPSMHALWLQAGGGTDTYDVDRYVGLLREHGYAKERVGLIEILRQTFARHGELPVGDPELEAFGRTLTDELGKHGYRIHDIVRCIRPAAPPEAYGRPMTPDEVERLAIPDQTRPRRRR